MASLCFNDLNSYFLSWQLFFLYSVVLSTCEMVQHSSPERRVREKTLVIHFPSLESCPVFGKFPFQDFCSTRSPSSLNWLTSCANRLSTFPAWIGASSMNVDSYCAFISKILLLFQKTSGGTIQILRRSSFKQMVPFWHPRVNRLVWYVLLSIKFGFRKLNENKLN